MTDEQDEQPRSSTHGLLQRVGLRRVGDPHRDTVRVTSPERSDVPDRQPHRVHQVAMRAAPFVLWSLGLLTLVGGALLDRPGDVSITMLTIGLVMVLAGAVLPRAGDFKAGKEGVEVELLRVAEVDGFAVDVAKGPVPLTIDIAAEAEVGVRVTAPVAHTTPTGAELLSAALANGWSVSSAGSRHFHLAKTNIKPADPTRLSPGDSVTVSVPSDLHAPVPPRVLSLLAAAGFTMPHRTPALVDPEDHTGGAESHDSP